MTYTIASARLKLHGLDPAAQYEVTDVDTSQPVQITGKELMDKGLPVSIAEQPGALLFCYRKGT